MTDEALLNRQFRWIRPAATQRHAVSARCLRQPLWPPQGSFSVREAWRRKLRKGWQSDTEAGEGEAPIGKLARDIADLLLNAIERGDAEAVRTIATAIAEAEGKPQERVEHSGTVKRVSIQLEDTPEDPGDVEELL